jgi:hypothetical protein
MRVPFPNMAVSKNSLPPRLHKLCLLLSEPSPPSRARPRSSHQQQGRFVLPVSVSAGAASRAELEGFRTANYQNVTANVGGNTTLRVTLSTAVESDLPSRFRGSCVAIFCSRSRPERTRSGDCRACFRSAEIATFWRAWRVRSSSRHRLVATLFSQQTPAAGPPGRRGSEATAETQSR